MKVCSWNTILSLAVQQMNKPAVYVSNGMQYDTPHDDEVWKFVHSQVRNIYGDNTPQYFEIMAGLIDSSLFFFETEAEQQKFYTIFDQPLTDSSAIYACTYSANGECESENT